MMDLPLNEKSQRLLDCFLNIPPDFSKAEELIRQELYTPEEITKVAIHYAEECQFNVGDSIFQDNDDSTDLLKATHLTGVVPGLHSTYVYDVISLLLKNGLEVNAVYESQYSRYNIMSSILDIDNEYIAADTMLLLLEHGGDPNLHVDGETIYKEVAFAIWCDSGEQRIRWRYDSWVHLWMVLIAYGGAVRNITRVKEYGSSSIFDLRKLKDHRNYYVGLSIDNKESVVHIYDKRTLWEVARW